MKINSINNYFNFNNISHQKKITVIKNDSFSFRSINTDVLKNKGIINKNSDISEHFKQISNKIFNTKKEEKIKNEFNNYLNKGYIGLSSSVLRNINSPSSAIGIKIYDNMSNAKILTVIASCINQNKAIGFNLSENKNPTDKIRLINSFLKFKEKSTARPPAGIALLNIDNNNILDFINLKNNADYNGWCLDLSVVMTRDYLNSPNKTIYNNLLESMLNKGEPGIIFSNNKNYICDACGAKELKPNENFVISHINLSKFAKDKKVNYKELKKVSNILAKAMYKTDKNSCIGVVGYQELLNKLNYNYQDKEAIDVLSSCLRIIQHEAHNSKLKTAISPTGTVSKYLNVTPNIQPASYDNITYINQLDTIAAAQKYIDCNISNTIILNKNANVKDVDNIVRYASDNNLKGITVFKKY